MIDGNGYSVTAPEVVIWPTECVPWSVNQRFPFGPTVIFTGDIDWDRGYWVTWPDVVILAIAWPPFSANHRLPSGPIVIPWVNWCWRPIGNSVIWPLAVIRPILSPKFSVNQRLPSGPTVMPNGLPPSVGSLNSVIWPRGVIRPMALDTVSFSVNQRLPSGPVMIWFAEPEGDRTPCGGSGNSVIAASSARPSSPSTWSLELRWVETRGFIDREF